MKKYFATPELRSTTEIDYLATPRVALENEIIAALVDFEEGLTREELVEYLGYSPQDSTIAWRVECALKQLLDEGKITYEDA